jgi:CRP/FNR family transcriptional regulator, cyclic AMP receptor protein
MDQNQVRRTFSDGQTIFNQGDRPDFVYIVRSGAVKIFRVHEGKSTTLGVLKPGEMFGEMAVFGHKTRSASAQSVGATECTLLAEAEFRELAGGPEVWGLLEKMSQRIREVDDHIEKLNLENLNRQDALSSIRLRRSSFV